MLTNQKILILILIGVFGFVVLRVWVSLKQTYYAATANFAISASKREIPLDTDGDGLADMEESFHNTDFKNPDTDGDGYLDGEEIVSGHNPRVASPDDVKPGSMSNRALAINLTDRMNGRILASAYEGEISPQTIETDINNALDGIAFNTMVDSAEIFFTEPIDESEISISPSGSKENEQKYFEALLLIIQRRLLSPYVTQQYELLELFNDLENASTNFSQKADKYYESVHDASNELQAVQVPKEWKDVHLTLLNHLYGYRIAYQAMSLSENDVIKSLLSLQRIIALNNKSSELLTEIVSLAERRELNIPSIPLINIYRMLLN